MNSEHSTYHVYPKTDPDGFEFSTIAGVTYACYFVSAKEVFSDYPDVAKTIYSFNLNVEVGSRTEQTADTRIALTVTSIIKTFLMERQSAVVYLCDTLDGRQILRKRKFDSWFGRSTISDIIKIDREISNAYPVILNSLILSKSHPLYDRIIFVFHNFNEKMNHK